MRVLAGTFAAFVLACAVAAQATGDDALVRVRGLMLDAAGQPLAKAGASLGEPDALTTAAVLATPQARCAADGTFEVTAVRPRDARHAPHALMIAAPGKVGLFVPNVEVLIHQRHGATGAPLDLGELRLPDGFTLTGRVRGADGKPL